MAHADVSSDMLGRLADEQSALRRVATLVAREAAPEEVFAAVAKEVAGVLGVRLTSVIRYDPADTATQVGVWGREIPYPVGTAWPANHGGVSGLIWRTGKPARVDYTDVDGTIAAALVAESVRYAVGVPIIVDGRLWGAMMALSTDQAKLPDGIEDRLANFTELVATAIANTQARDELRRLADEQSALRRVATLVAEGAAPFDVFDAVCEETARLMGATSVSLDRFTPDGFNVTMAGWSVAGNHVPTGTRLPLDGDVINTLIGREQAPARIESYDGIEGPIAALVRSLGIRAQVGAPVVIEGSIWGALIAGFDRAELLPPGAETRLARFAELIATGVANATARTELLRTQRRVIEAADATRERLTRDIHDGAQQQFVNTLINLQIAQHKFSTEPDLSRQLLDRAAQEAIAGLDGLRELASGLHPAILTNRGLSAALDALAERLPLPVDLELAPGKLARALEASVYFFCSEALTNVIKHAQASTASIRIVEHANELIVEVRDDGIGGADPRAGGSGLRGLRDRIAALEGTLEIDSTRSGGGTTLTARIPVLAGSLPGPPELGPDSA
jgi:signal transduction histidine kinase